MKDYFFTGLFLHPIIYSDSMYGYAAQIFFFKLNTMLTNAFNFTKTKWFLKEQFPESCAMSLPTSPNQHFLISTGNYDIIHIHVWYHLMHISLIHRFLILPHVVDTNIGLYFEEASTIIWYMQYICEWIDHHHYRQFKHRDQWNTEHHEEILLSLHNEQVVSMSVI